MNSLYDAASEAHRFFAERQWRYCIIGGLAVVRWGEPRATQDVDISLLTGLENERSYIDAMLSQFTPRVPDAARFALENRVLLVRASNGVALDVALAGFPIEQQMGGRAWSDPPSIRPPGLVPGPFDAEDALRTDWG